MAQRVSERERETVFTREGEIAQNTRNTRTSDKKGRALWAPMIAY